MQATPILVSDQAHPEASKRLEDLAHQLAEIHTGVYKSIKPWGLLPKHLRGVGRNLAGCLSKFQDYGLKRPGLFPCRRMDVG